MSIVEQLPPPMTKESPCEADQRLVLPAISCQTYESLAKLLEESHVRLTYDRGSLELTAPSYAHESDKCWLGRLVETIAEELGLPIHPGGSTTFKRAELQRGLEPDNCYWIAHEAAMRGRRTFDLTRDPPPDLALEIDLTSSSIDRMPIYAALRVLEVWRYDGNALHVFVLRTNGDYEECSASPNFPRIPLEGIERFLCRDRGLDYLSVIRAFREWVREQIG